MGRSQRWTRLSAQPYGALVAAALAVQAGGNDGITVALITAVGGFAGVVVAGVFALLKDRKPEPPVVRYLDPPTSNMLPAELSELLADERLRVRERDREMQRLRAEVDLWQERAFTAGWRP